MHADQQDHEIRQHFQRQREEDARSTPGFFALLTRERATRTFFVRWFRVASAAALIAFIAIIVPSLHRHAAQPEVVAQQAEVFSQWQASSDALLSSSSSWTNSSSISTDWLMSSDNSVSSNDTQVN